jgi:aryl-alcohol dehydrogenase-like predicted oxidoreductase
MATANDALPRMNHMKNETRIRLGKSAVLIPPMGIGAWAWGDRWYWGYGSSYSASDLRDAFRLCLDAGVDFFDTAEIYGFGTSEKLLGQFMRESQRTAVLATKFFPLPWRLRRGDVTRALRTSLRRLDMKQVDLYQIHWPFGLLSIEKRAEALADTVDAGLTRAIGVSNYNRQQTQRTHTALAQRGIPLASNQIEYSLLQREPERSGLMQLCNELGVRVIAYSPLAQGILSGKYSSKNCPPGLRGRNYSAHFLDAVQPLIQLMRAIGVAHDSKSPSQVALNWVMCKGAVPIPGVKNARQAQDNIGALGWRLTDAEVRALDEASQGIASV